jgi:hypothetical protein
MPDSVSIPQYFFLFQVFFGKKKMIFLKRFFFILEFFSLNLLHDNEKYFEARSISVLTY